jgi:hypothetical protein
MKVQKLKLNPREEKRRKRPKNLREKLLRARTVLLQGIKRKEEDSRRRDLL